MSSNVQILIRYWEQKELNTFFKNLLHAIHENLLAGEDIDYFLDLLQRSYPINEVETFNEGPIKEYISKSLEFDINENLQDAEKKVITHYWEYFAKEFKDGQL